MMSNNTPGTASPEKAQRPKLTLKVEDCNEQSITAGGKTYEYGLGFLKRGDLVLDGSAKGTEVQVELALGKKEAGKLYINRILSRPEGGSQPAAHEQPVGNGAPQDPRGGSSAQASGSTGQPSEGSNPNPASSDTASEEGGVRKLSIRQFDAIRKIAGKRNQSDEAVDSALVTLTGYTLAELSGFRAYALMNLMIGKPGKPREGQGQQ